MRKLLYWAVGLIARLHDKIMQLNNAFETNFTDINSTQIYRFVFVVIC